MVRSIITVFLLIAGMLAHAADYLVTSEEECKAAMKKAKAGDAIIWRDGSYKDVKISFQPAADGTEKQPIILKAQTAGKVIFTGSSMIILRGNYLQAEGFLFKGASTLTDADVLAFSSTASHCRITNCSVMDYSPADAMVNNNWISLQGTYNEVDHCSFSGKTNQGPYLVVRYLTGKDYVDGSDAAPSTHHHIHHNYFGYRTLPSDNGGEDMRIGDSKTSFTHGFNIIEYNYFEDHRLEAEVISNKSWDNIYRFNSFVNCDGAMVLRHGQRCFVYGNYFDGTIGRGKSGGIRIINPNQTVFNNYITNIEGSDKEVLKGGIVIMCGLDGSPLNGYYPADNAIVAYNTMINCAGPVVKIGFGNKSKNLPLVAPKKLSIVSNLIIGTTGKDNSAAIEGEPVTYAVCRDNFYTNGSAAVKGFSFLKKDKLVENNGFISADLPLQKAAIDSINQRLSIHNIHLAEKEITRFEPSWKMDKKAAGVSWKL